MSSLQVGGDLSRVGGPKSFAPVVEAKTLNLGQMGQHDKTVKTL